MPAAKQPPPGDPGPNLDAVVQQLTSIGTEIKALREGLTPAPSDEQPDPAVTAARNLVDGLQGSLLAVSPPAPPVTAESWDGTDLGGVEMGSRKVDGHFIALTLADGRRADPEEIKKGNAKFKIGGGPIRIFRMEISATADGPCVGVGGPVAVDPVPNGGG